MNASGQGIIYIILYVAITRLLKLYFITTHVNVYVMENIVHKKCCLLENLNLFNFKVRYISIYKYK